MNQLSLFDTNEYESPSTHGKPDWAYDISDLEPPISKSHQCGHRRSFIDDTGGRNSTPGVASFITKPDFTHLSYAQNNQLSLLNSSQAIGLPITLSNATEQAGHNPISPSPCSVASTDNRTHNRKSCASGWISPQYKYRNSEGVSRTSTTYKPGCTGPYYQYQWRDGDRIRSRYVPKKKLQRVQDSIATREPVAAILSLLS